MLLPEMFLKINDASTVLSADQHAIIVQKAEYVIAVVIRHSWGTFARTFVRSVLMLLRLLH
jgi:hypothetical protein